MVGLLELASCNALDSSRTSYFLVSMGTERQGFEQELQDILGYQFQKTGLIQQALLHKSVAPDAHVSHFERLEFLGDRVLNLVISHKIYCLFSQETERDLSIRLSKLVNCESLYRVAQRLHLKKYVHCDATNPSQKKILSDALEALIGALFLDADLKTCDHYIQKWWHPLFEEANHTPEQDSKSALQEWTQKHYGTLPVYRLIKKTGPAHAPCIEIELHIKTTQETLNLPILRAVGSSRRLAEKDVAENMLSYLKKHQETHKTKIEDL